MGIPKMPLSVMRVKPALIESAAASSGVDV